MRQASDARRAEDAVGALGANSAGGAVGRRLRNRLGRHPAATPDSAPKTAPKSPTPAPLRSARFLPRKRPAKHYRSMQKNHKVSLCAETHHLGAGERVVRRG